MLAFTGEIVGAVLEEFAGGAVERQRDVLAQGVARVADRLLDDRQRFGVGREVRRETALVADRGGKPLGREHFLQRMEDLGARAQRFAEVRRAHRLDHEFLDIDVIVGMFAAVEDVHHRHRHGVLARLAVELGDVGVERHALLGCRCLGRGQRDGENRVGAQACLVVGAIQRQHGVVESALIAGIHAQEALADLAVDGVDGLQHALAQIARLVPVAQFQRFTRAGGSTAGRTGAARDAAAQRDLCLDGGVAAGIEYFEGADINDLSHVTSSCRLKNQWSRVKRPALARTPGAMIRSW